MISRAGRVGRPGRPWDPRLVLFIAALLPGAGHVANRMPVRGLVFAFYMVLLGTVTFHLTTPDHSFLGRYAGGLFVYAISILDAYKWAVVRTRSAGETRHR